MNSKTHIIPVNNSCVDDPLTRIPLIEELTTGPIPAGSNILIEYEPKSQWYNASIGIAAGSLRAGGRVLYGSIAQPPDRIRSRLSGLGLDVEEFEKQDKLRIWDWYTGTLGRKSNEKLAAESLKVADLSIWFSKQATQQAPDPNMLRIFDSISVIARFNDEKSWIELLLSRILPFTSVSRSTTIRGLMKGVHSEWSYNQLEAANDGVIDLRLDETGEETRNVIRISTMRNVGFDSRWHRLDFAENFEVTLEK